MSLSPIALEALRAAQAAFSESEADVYEDALARGLEAVDREGRLVGAFAASELARLESLVNAQPATLSEAQVEALAAAGNGAVNDYEHERQCSCSKYPEGCATDPRYRRSFGYWDTGAFEIGMGAVIGLWESMRADAAAVELGRLRARVAELEAERHSTNEAPDDAVQELQARRSLTDAEAAVMWTAVDEATPGHIFKYEYQRIVRAAFGAVGIPLAGFDPDGDE